MKAVDEIKSEKDQAIKDWLNSPGKKKLNDVVEEFNNALLLLDTFTEVQLLGELSRATSRYYKIIELTDHLPPKAARQARQRMDYSTTVSQIKLLCYVLNEKMPRYERKRKNTGTD